MSREFIDIANDVIRIDSIDYIEPIEEFTGRVSASTLNGIKEITNVVVHLLSKDKNGDSRAILLPCTADEYEHIKEVLLSDPDDKSQYDTDSNVFGINFREDPNE